MANKKKVHAYTEEFRKEAVRRADQKGNSTPRPDNEHWRSVQHEQKKQLLGQCSNGVIFQSYES